MGSTLIKVANFLAKMSTPKWNACKAMRGFCRVGYWAMSEIYIRLFDSRSGMEIFRGSCENTYPWPYRDVERFADWPEEADAEKGYTLICDYSGFVIRRGPSYVAWKMKELHGKWPKTPSGSHPHAKDWLGYLEELGYSDYWTAQEIINAHLLLPASPRFFVGINPKYGEYGQVYWFESVVTCLDVAGKQVSAITVTTYENFEFKIFSLTTEDPITWVKVGGGA